MKKKSYVISLSKRILKELKPLCKKIQIAGSIRRGKLNPVDVDIVLIPKDKEKIKRFLSNKGKFIEGGEKEMTFKIESVKVELYFTNEKEWGAMLMAFSGKRGSNIGLRIIARTKGLKLTRQGLFERRTGKIVAGRTEHEIYKALNRPYKEPWER